MNFGFLTLALLCAVSDGVLADSERERDRIGADRAAANATLAERQRECATRFVVAACVDEARTAHRETLQRLRQQELQLDEATRRAAVEGRRKSFADRAQPLQPRASEAPPDAPRVRMRRAASASASSADDQTVRADAPYKHFEPAAGGSRGAAEQLEQQKFETRQRDAEDHRTAVAQRNALRDARGRVAAPLPGPSAPR